MASWNGRKSTPKRLPETLTVDEQTRLLAAPKIKAPTGHRDLCMITLMLNTGIRASECLGLKIQDIDWVSGRFVVRTGKNSKDRVLWINPSDLSLLKSWKERMHIRSGLIFRTLHGTAIKDRDLRAMVKRRGQRAGILKDIHPHTLRHTFATDLYRKTRNLLVVQKALGHSDITTTTIYTHLADHEVEDAMKLLRGTIL